jgi:hypothetical protein
MLQCEVKAMSTTLPISRGAAAHVILVIFAAPWLAVAAPAETNELQCLTAHHAPTQALLGRRTIRVAGQGTIPVDFRAALGVLMQSNLLDRVQQEYANSLPAGQTPEFTLQPLGSNAWSFVNRQNQRSEVHEVARHFAGTNALFAVFYAKGERFFGLFESLTMIRVTPASEGQVSYTVEVRAYPHQAVSRFVIRHLGLVERFFRNKTKELEGVTARICQRLCAAAAG